MKVINFLVLLFFAVTVSYSQEVTQQDVSKSEVPYKSISKFIKNTKEFHLQRRAYKIKSNKVKVSSNVYPICDFVIFQLEDSLLREDFIEIRKKCADKISIGEKFKRNKKLKRIGSKWRQQISIIFSEPEGNIVMAYLEFSGNKESRPDLGLTYIVEYEADQVVKYDSSSLIFCY